MFVRNVGMSVNDFLRKRIHPDVIHSERNIVVKAVCY